MKLEKSDLLTYMDKLSEHEDYAKWLKDTFRSEVSYTEWKGLSPEGRATIAGEGRLIGGKLIPIATILIGAATANEAYAKWRYKGYGPFEAAMRAEADGFGFFDVETAEKFFRDLGERKLSEDEALGQLCLMSSPGGVNVWIRIVDIIHMMNLTDRGWRTCHCF